MGDDAKSVSLARTNLEREGFDVITAADGIEALVAVPIPMLSERAASADRVSGIAVTVDVPATLRARAQPDHLAQMLANLLQNAVRYTPTNGSVSVAVSRRPSDMVVSVTKTRQAIPTADLPHLFERFYRVEKSRDAAQGGAGIELAIVKRLVEMGGGQVGAESEAERTRVWFNLPA